MNDPQSTEHLKLAFVVFLTQEIIEADQKIDYQEMKLFGQIFPRPLLRELGFIDDQDNFTAEFERARQASLVELPKQLNIDEKLELLTLLHGACLADGELGSGELDQLRRGGDLLGLTPNEFTAHIASLSAE
jgi:uncharacterized tellurite resistance protein B-like protein